MPVVLTGYARYGPKMLAHGAGAWRRLLVEPAALLMAEDEL
jgi:hypothetical protein